MTNDKELLQQALDALIKIQVCLNKANKTEVITDTIWMTDHETLIDFIGNQSDLIRARLAQPEQEPVAWRTFDGEGGYEFRSYEMNENYAEEWAQRNPNHKGWVEPLYKDPTPCQTCESLARTVMMDQTSHDTAPPQREWQGLTDEEISSVDWKQNETLHDFARAIEAKLKEKNA